MRRLCLDLGTSTGFAIGREGEIVSGHWDLKPSRFDGGGMRFVKFRQRLNELNAAYSVQHIFFEEVRRHRGVDAAHVYGGLMATLTAWCEEQKITYSAFPVGRIKKEWTGMGNASKEAMVQEARRRGFDPKTDDEADALAIFHLSLVEYPEGVSIASAA